MSSPQDLLNLTASIVAAHVGHNVVDVRELRPLIEQVHDTLTSLGGTDRGNGRVPAVPVKKSIMPDHIICLEDGKKLKMLRRHLKTAYGLTPEQYRERWGLPGDYPMTAPRYAEQRSRLAKQIGLGKGDKKAK
jgi:predicted transcriptional regulator